MAGQQKTLSTHVCSGEPVAKRQDELTTEEQKCSKAGVKVGKNLEKRVPSMKSGPQGGRK